MPGQVEEAKASAKEQVSLSRAELWLLRIAAATGIIGMLSHGIDLMHELGVI